MSKNPEKSASKAKSGVKGNVKQAAKSGVKGPAPAAAAPPAAPAQPKDAPKEDGGELVRKIRFYKVPSPEYKTKEEVVYAFGYVLEKQLAKGGFGTVFLCEDMRKKIKVACKWMDLGTTKNDPRLSDTKNELMVIEKVRHPYVIKLYCHFVVEDPACNNLYIFMELANGGDLYKYIQKRGLPTETEVKKYWAQILCGINHMHGYGIAHRDIKPQNVLLLENKRSISGDYLLQITDFGLSVKTDATKLNKTGCGTPVFMAPELFEKIPYNAFVVDVWALGVTLFVIYTLDTPFDYRKDQKDQVADMKAKNWKFPDSKPASKEMLAYIKPMLEPDMKKRVKLADSIMNPWISADYDAAHALSDAMKTEAIVR